MKPERYFYQIRFNKPQIKSKQYISMLFSSLKECRFDSFDLHFYIKDRNANGSFVKSLLRSFNELSSFIAPDRPGEISNISDRFFCGLTDSGLFKIDPSIVSSVFETAILDPRVEDAILIFDNVNWLSSKSTSKRDFADNNWNVLRFPNSKKYFNVDSASPYGWDHCYLSSSLIFRINKIVGSREPSLFMIVESGGEEFEQIAELVKKECGKFIILMGRVKEQHKVVVHDPDLLLAAHRASTLVREDMMKLLDERKNELEAIYLEFRKSVADIGTNEQLSIANTFRSISLVKGFIYDSERSGSGIYVSSRKVDGMKNFVEMDFAPIAKSLTLSFGWSFSSLWSIQIAIPFCTGNQSDVVHNNRELERLLEYGFAAFVLLFEDLHKLLGRMKAYA